MNLIINTSTFCFLLSISFALISTKTSAQEKQDDLEGKITFYSENYPPANFVQEGELKGITIESAKLMWQKLSMKEQPIYMVPWARGYRNTLLTPNSALFTMSRTEERENLFKWLGPLFQSRHMLIAKKSKNIKVSNLGELFQYNVATIRGDISEMSLQKIGYPELNMAKVTELERAFYMMQSDRVELLMVSIHGFTHLTEKLGVNADLYEHVWHVNTVGNFIAFNKDTPDSIIERYRLVFEETEKERGEIRVKYGMPRSLSN